MSKEIAFVDGKFGALKKAAVPVTDMALLRGYGVFETIRIYGHAPLALASHFQRINLSLRLLGMKQDYPANFLKAKIAEGLRRSRISEGSLKIIITGGDSLDLELARRTRLIILFMRPRIYPSQYYRRGIRLMTSPLARPIPEAKSLNYLPAVRAYNEARQKGFDDALHIDERGCIREGTVFNFAIVKNRELISSEKGVLPGVTIRIVEKLGRAIGFKFIWRDIKYSELKTADEAFTASSTREVVPVVAVDKIRIGNGKPGDITKKLLQKYREFARK